MIRSLSIVIKGKDDGLEPVAIIVFLAEICSTEPSCFVTLIVVAFSKDQTPSKTVILFLSIKYLTPPHVWSTTVF